MSIVVAFARFWYGLVVGDDWKPAVGVAVALAVGAGLAAVGAAWTAPLAAVAILAAFSLGVLVDVRRRS